MENAEIITVLNNINNKPISNEKRYEEMIRFIHEELNKKDIYFSEELKTRYDLRYREIKFDDMYFENGHYNSLFVVVSALADEEVYLWLLEAYNLTHAEKFSKDVLQKEVERFEKQMGGFYYVNFTEINDCEDFGLIYAQKTFYTNNEDTYDIYGSHYQVMEDGKIRIKFLIEAHNISAFYAIIDDNAEFQEAIKYQWPKRDDLLYIIAEDQLKDQVSEWMSEEN